MLDIVMTEHERRRLARFPTWCISSIAYGTDDHASARVIDVSWSGLGLTIDRIEYPRFEKLLERNAVGTLRLGLIKSQWGILRARAEVARAELRESWIRLGLVVNWADPHYYDFVQALGNARSRLN